MLSQSSWARRRICRDGMRCVGAVILLGEEDIQGKGRNTITTATILRYDASKEPLFKGGRLL